MGCEFWPTVGPNPVWSVFDFGVGVVNVTDEEAFVKVTRGGHEVSTELLPPRSSRTLYLPWLPALKGDDWNSCTNMTPASQSHRAQNGAYHLISSRPVSVYQLSAVQPGPAAGPEGKDWSACPPADNMGCSGTPCFSYSNEASLLLPTSSLTGSYRITGYNGNILYNTAPYLTVTATEASTLVSIRLSSTGHIAVGNDILAAGPGGSISLTLQLGEVAQILGTPTSDFSGSLVSANKPVQVLAGLPCTMIPIEEFGCSHIEEVVLPAETFGRRYVVPVPVRPDGEPASHIVRLYGHVDDTKLTFTGITPPNAPSSLDAGDMVELGLVSDDFEVSGDHAFGISMFSLVRSELDPEDAPGGPTQSAVIPVEQYRARHSFFTPAGYDVVYANIVQPLGATVTIDGAPVHAVVTPINDDFGVARALLGAGQAGMHVVEASEPISIQVQGYGTRAGYQYPAGLRLEHLGAKD
ncbi:IgGFc-binding protein [Chondromyces crocatus]|uniref:IgGFc-binding protein N-terminal domain-containing protein n=1 Tax=Chondromyces crocatus TaxID=52 RepID=A0A0K1EGC7_CHOCO|nr:IgGFc-binding protein [Chondromyces crocatus]AKT39904.1 uncharacterized protein CMC5_040550 [Chondromyces crocatus]